MLILENIHGGYRPGSQVLQGIDLEIKAGETVGIIGLNGCGKSTLGKAVLNILPFREGRVMLGGIDVSKMHPHQLRQHGIAMVLQGGRVFPNMTVLEQLKLAGNEQSDLAIIKRLSEVENITGLTIFVSGKQDSFLKRKGNHLSGGEKQQLSLIMALLSNPRLLILDEASAGLSPGNLMKMTVVIEKLKAIQSMAIMLIEQNIRLAVRLSDRLLLLERGIIGQQFEIDETFDLNKLNKNIFN